MNQTQNNLGMTQGSGAPGSSSLGSTGGSQHWRDADTKGMLAPLSPARRLKRNSANATHQMAKAAGRSSPSRLVGGGGCVGVENEGSACHTHARVLDQPTTSQWAHVGTSWADGLVRRSL
eukprot:COSAG05_NODE_1756_length_4142_cov_1.848627_3_plen_120_part_00